MVKRGIFLLPREVLHAVFGGTYNAEVVVCMMGDRFVVCLIKEFVGDLSWRDIMYK